MNEKTKLLSEITMLAIEVQEKTNHAVFVSLSGHVEKMHIRICESKEEYNKRVAECGFYTGKKGSLERMKEVKQTLLQFIGDEEVDVEQLDYEIEEVKHYQF